jgi:hypothetical protein
MRFEKYPNRHDLQLSILAALGIIFVALIFDFPVLKKKKRFSDPTNTETTKRLHFLSVFISVAVCSATPGGGRTIVLAEARN